MLASQRRARQQTRRPSVRPYARPSVRPYARPGVACVSAALLLGLAACGTVDPFSGKGSGRLSVTTGFYPLTYLAERVGGDRVDVTTLTKPGAEPHDLEVSPRDVAGLRGSDLVVYLPGFQPAVDDAVRTAEPVATFDAVTAADLNRADAPADGAKADGAAKAGTDPHFWLDPARMAAVATDLGQALAEVDPDGRSTFQANLKRLRAELADLDREFRAGLARCAIAEVVTSHAAFGYLTSRYGLRQVGIAGLEPQTEPGARRLAVVAQVVRERRVTTIYYESLVDPAAARTVARETGARVDVLDPVEGVTADSRGQDYPSIMRANLTALRRGQSCR
jgi:zinc transport system substrate-binding protein